MDPAAMNRWPLYLLWALTLTSIPIISVFGRPLQKWAFTRLGAGQVAILLGTVLFLLLFLLVIYLARHIREHRRIFFSGFVLAVFFLLVQWKIPVVEERLHVILFGLFGFLSFRLFPVPLGIVFCIVLSAGDELLQLYLVDRVGELHDVYLNLLSTGLGGFLSIYARWVVRSGKNPGGTARNPHE